MSKTVIIIGAGPAGLTAAYELVKQRIFPVVLENWGGDKHPVNYTQQGIELVTNIWSCFRKERSQ